MCGVWATVDMTNLLATVHILYKYHRVFQFVANCLELSLEIASPGHVED